MRGKVWSQVRGERRGAEHENKKSKKVKAARWVVADDNGAVRMLARLARKYFIYYFPIRGELRSFCSPT